jgi:phage terminase large subunit-like protein
VSISTACPDWRQRLIERRSLVPETVLNEAEAARAARIFDRLKLPDVIGQPTIGESVGDWYRDAVRALFGSYDVATNSRRVATVHMILPKKQGKTTLSAGTMLTALMMNRRPNARFGILGATQKISGEAYDAAAGMIDADKKLQRFLKPTDHIKTIEHRLTGAYLEVTSFDTKVATGGKFAGCLIDELHVLGSVAKADRVIGQVRGARVALPESFIWFITTQSEEPPAGIFLSELRYARMVRDGEIEDQSYLPIIYEFPMELQADESRPWENPDIWYQVMPSLGVAVQRGVLEEQFRADKVKGEADLRRWASQHLNIEIGVAMHADRWGGAQDWQACADRRLNDLEELIARSEVIVIGIDCGGRDDLFSLCVLGREKGNGESHRRRWLAWGHNWLHEDGVKLRQANAARYDDFEKAKELTIVKRLGEDVDQAVAIIRRVYDTGLLASIALDPNRVSTLLDALVSAGIEPPYDDQNNFFASIRQGTSLSDPCVAIERKLNAGEFLHAGQAIMAWAVGNAKCERVANAMIVTKKASGTAKIDPFIALLNAGYMMGRNPEPIGAGQIEIISI